MFDSMQQLLQQAVSVESKHCLFNIIEENNVETYDCCSMVTAPREIFNSLPSTSTSISLIVGVPLSAERLIWMLMPSSWHCDTSKWLQVETSW